MEGATTGERAALYTYSSRQGCQTLHQLAKTVAPAEVDARCAACSWSNAGTSYRVCQAVQDLYRLQSLHGELCITCEFCVARFALPAKFVMPVL
jgi:hypothetical protein